MKPFWNVRAAQDDPRTGEVFLYGPIEGDPAWTEDDQTPLGFVRALQDLGEVDELDIRINSPGGSVFAGNAMYSILRRHEARKRVTVDGVAASIASVVAMAGDEVVMPTNAMMMLHNPHGMSIGFAEDHRKVADELDRIREGLVAAYKDKTGLRRSEIIKLMDAETWLTAAEAKDKGFADRVESRRVSASMATENLLVLNGLGVQLDRYDTRPPLHLITDEFKDNAHALLGQVAAFATRTQGRAEHRQSAGRPASENDRSYWQQIRDTADRVLDGMVADRPEPTEADTETVDAAPDEGMTAAQKLRAHELYERFAGGIQ